MKYFIIDFKLIGEIYQSKVKLLFIFACFLILIKTQPVFSVNNYIPKHYGMMQNILLIIALLTYTMIQKSKKINILKSFVIIFLYSYLYSFLICLMLFSFSSILYSFFTDLRLLSIRCFYLFNPYTINLVLTLLYVFYIFRNEQK